MQKESSRNIIQNRAPFNLRLTSRTCAGLQSMVKSEFALWARALMPEIYAKLPPLRESQEKGAPFRSYGTK